MGEKNNTSNVEGRNLMMLQERKRATRRRRKHKPKGHKNKAAGKGKDKNTHATARPTTRRLRSIKIAASRSRQCERSAKDGQRTTQTKQENG